MHYLTFNVDVLEKRLKELMFNPEKHMTLDEKVERALYLLNPMIVTSMYGNDLEFDKSTLHAFEDIQQDMYYTDPLSLETLFENGFITNDNNVVEHDVNHIINMIDYASYETVITLDSVKSIINEHASDHVSLDETFNLKYHIDDINNKVYFPIIEHNVLGLESLTNDLFKTHGVPVEDDDLLPIDDGINPETNIASYEDVFGQIKNPLNNRQLCGHVV